LTILSLFFSIVDSNGYDWMRRVAHILYLYSDLNNNNIVTHIPIARQRLGKHIPEVMLSTIEGHRLPGNGSLNTFPPQQIRKQ
jgi:hypothetical protein